MLRGVAAADGFAIVRPGPDAPAGTEVDLAPLPLLAGERT
jgi:molybdopterin molybdotransferase